MEYKDQIKQIADRVAKMKEKILTEEATKNAFIMPLIRCLGYDIFSPMEVVPEFIADIGIKRRKKVDYAILKDEQPIILIECRHSSLLLILVIASYSDIFIRPRQNLESLNRNLLAGNILSLSI